MLSEMHYENFKKLLYYHSYVFQMMMWQERDVADQHNAALSVSHLPSYTCGRQNIIYQRFVTINLRFLVNKSLNYLSPPLVNKLF